MNELFRPRRVAHWVGAGLIFIAWPHPTPATPAQNAGAPTAHDTISNQLGGLLAAGKLNEADALSRRYLSQGTVSAPTCLEIGRAYFEHDQWQRASAFFRKSLALQEQNDTAHLLLGLALGELKQMEEAERELLLAAEQNPRRDTNCYMAGRVLLLREKYEAALPYLYKALQLNPGDPRVYQALALALTHTGSYGLAETYDTKAIEIVEREGLRNLEPYLDLSYLLLLSNQKEAAARALEYARKAIAIDPQSGGAHFLYGKALLKLERFAEARDELLTAARFMPQDARPHYLLAQVYERLGQPEQAHAARKSFAQLNKQRADESLRLGGLRP